MTGFTSSGGVVQDQPASFLFLFRLGGENPPTPALFPHSAPRHSPFGFSLHGKIQFLIAHFLFLYVFSCDKKGNLKPQIIFPSFSPTWKYSGEIEQRVGLSLPSPERHFSADMKLYKHCTSKRDISPSRRKQWVGGTELQKYIRSGEITSSSLPTVPEALSLKG